MGVVGRRPEHLDMSSGIPVRYPLDGHPLAGIVAFVVFPYLHRPPIFSFYTHCLHCLPYPHGQHPVPYHGSMSDACPGSRQDNTGVNGMRVPGNK